MSQQSIPVQPNRVTTLNVALPSGATIFNPDPNNAIWVGNNPGIAPNAGMRIGPKGSLTWSSDKQPCYACVDTGVATNVTVNISTDVINVVNPIDVGIAVATALAVQGVPSVLVGDLIYNAAIPAAGSTFVIIPVDISRYANLTVLLESSTRANRYTLTYRDSASGVVTYNQQAIDAVGVAAASPITVESTVRGDQLIVYRTDTVAATWVTIYASNRTVKETVAKNPEPLTVTLSGVAFTAPTKVYFTGSFRSQGGQFYVRMVTTGTLTGYLGFRYLDTFGAAQTYDILDSDSGHVGPDGKEVQTMIQLPQGIFQFYYSPRINTTATVVLTVVPA